MLKVLLAIAVLSAVGSTAALAGPCSVPSDRASDGSRCGDRAASERPGGK